MANRWLSNKFCTQKICTGKPGHLYFKLLPTFNVHKSSSFRAMLRGLYCGFQNPLYIYKYRPIPYMLNIQECWFIINRTTSGVRWKCIKVYGTRILHSRVPKPSNAFSTIIMLPEHLSCIVTKKSVIMILCQLVAISP